MHFFPSHYSSNGSTGNNFYHPSNQLPIAPLAKRKLSITPAIVINDTILPSFQTLCNTSGRHQNLNGISNKVSPLAFFPALIEKSKPQTLIEDGVYTKVVKGLYFPNLVLYHIEDNSILKIFDFNIRLKKTYFPEKILIDPKNITIKILNNFQLKDFIANNESRDYISITVPFQIFNITMNPFNPNHLFEKKYLEVTFYQERRLVDLPFIISTRKSICDRFIDKKNVAFEKLMLQNFFKKIGECRYAILLDLEGPSNYFQSERSLTIEQNWELQMNNARFKRKRGFIDLAVSEQPTKRARI